MFHVPGFVSCSSALTTAVPFGTDGAELEYFDRDIMDDKILEETAPQHSYLMSQESDIFGRKVVRIATSKHREIHY